MLLEIITIGDELLIGQTIDTNSAWLGKICNENGLVVNRITSISDKPYEITSTLDSAFSRVDLVIITGGLGPTKDDITKHVLCGYFNTVLERNQAVLEKIEAYFNSFSRPMLEVNRQQADLPKDATILHNELGTASGMWFSKNGKECISLPGVPYEMKGLMINEVLPKLSHIDSKVFHKHILTSGVGESWLAEMIKDWELEVSEAGYSLAYLPTPGLVKLRISCYNATEKDEYHITELSQKLLPLIGNFFVGFDMSNLPAALMKIAVDNKVSVSFAESCTGGRISADFVKQAGVSACYKGTVVAYSNQIKTDVLKINKLVLEKHGAVSEMIVSDMAKAAKELFYSDFSLATSGIAGPDGGSGEKPVGLVWFSVATPLGNTTEYKVFKGGREQVITNASNYGFNFLIRTMRDYFNNQKKGC